MKSFVFSALILASMTAGALAGSPLQGTNAQPLQGTNAQPVQLTNAQMDKMIELTEEELRAVTGGQNHGESTSAAVHWAQDYVETNGGQMGTQVSYFARNGLSPP
jgi:hypothetical protein